MALHPHVDDFYREWLAKADNYQEDNLASFFNKAFSLFTLYNKLYAEATFILARNDLIILDEKRGFPDRKGATEYTSKYLGSDRLLNLFNNDQECHQSISELIEHVENERFYIKLSMPYGERQPEVDRSLVRRMRSKDAKRRVVAVLDLIYSVRCNMFHGNKQFDQVQVDLLRPVTILLRKIIADLYLKLSM